MKTKIVGTDTVKLTNQNYTAGVITVSGDLGGGSAKLVFSNGDGDFIDVPDGDVVVGDVVELTHGLGNIPYIVVTGATELVVNYHGVK